MSGDNFKPRSLADSLFNDFDDIELPKQSTIHKKGLDGVKNAKKDIYEQGKQEFQDDFDILDLNLEAESKIVTKNQNSPNASSTNSTKNSEKQIRPKSQIKTIVSGSKIQRKGASKKQTKKAQVQKKEVDIDAQIGQVAQWGERKAQDNSDEDFDNDNEENKIQTKQQLDIKKKLEDKLKNNSFGTKSSSTNGGLKAKAEQIKRQKQQQQRQKLAKTIGMNVIDEKQSQQNLSSVGIIGSQINISQKSNVLKIKNEVVEQVEEDDPWDKVNKQTLKKIQQEKQNIKQLTLESVIHYYMQQFVVDLEEIQEPQQQVEDIQQLGCFQSLFACFAQKKKQKPQTNTTQPKNNKLIQRFLSISKKQLTNTNQQFFMLKKIWNDIVGKSFSRYGNHWNQIGFQGRDPATDLRSTGVLSLFQWMLFVEENKKLTSKYLNWTLQHQFPFALTHIKVTALFLDLITKRIIKGTSWQDFQKSYNGIIYGTFKKIMQNHKIGDSIGTIVEDVIRQMKVQHKDYIKQYQKISLNKTT